MSANGGFAFPHDDGPYVTHGMTLRDYFAAKALQGMVANPEPNVSNADWQTLAESAYVLADAMLSARQQDPTP